MIIWLASYPRSGNTLLRTLLKQCFDRSSYSRYPTGPELDPSLLASIGHRDLEADWQQFYVQATRSDESFLVKTHSPPPDAQPVLHLIRDGRSAIQSYRSYHEAYTEGHDPSLTALILGDDAYGDWTTHYRQWSQRSNARRLALRFEELVEPSRALIRKIGTFVGYEGTIARYHNPFVELHAKAPGFFRRGETTFHADPTWDETIDWLFHYVHGDLMRELGIISTNDHPAKPSAADLMARVTPVVSRLVTQRGPAGHLEGLKADRVVQLETIRRLNERLQESEENHVARLELIETLSAQLEDVEADRAARLELINNLSARLEEVEADRAERLRVIERLKTQLENE